MDKKRVRKCNVNVTIKFLGNILHYITLTSYYILTDKIQMTSNYSTIDVEEENNRVRKSQRHNQYS